MGNVNRCICSNIHFADMMLIAREQGFSTVEELRNHHICASHCMICAPFLEMMLKSGKTVFEPLQQIKPAEK